MKIFNSDDLPEPKAILEATVDAVNLAAEQRAREAYDKHMEKVNLGITVGLFGEKIKTRAMIREKGWKSNNINRTQDQITVGWGRSNIDQK